MNIVIAVDSFKGSFSAEQACAAITKGLMRYKKDLNVVQIPIADGGEGLLQILKNSPRLAGQHLHTVQVTGPYQKLVNADYITLPDGKAIIEMAQVCGLELTPPELRNAGQATSYGLGELLKHVLKQGHNHVIIGLGGSATNDGGIGFAQALGVRFFDKNNNLINAPACANDLRRVEHVDLSKLYPALADATIEASCDVNNPLLGVNGATWIYGPQKGADRAMLEQIESGMTQFNHAMTKAVGRDISCLAGAGAAGGMGAALLWFAQGQLRPGIELVLDLLNVREFIKNADLVITGEGKLDKQSSFGKAPAGIANMAAEYDKPVVALCGSLGEGAELLYSHNIKAMWSICSRPLTLQQAIDEAEELLADCAESLIRTLYIGKEMTQSLAPKNSNKLI